MTSRRDSRVPLGAPETMAEQILAKAIGIVVNGYTIADADQGVAACLGALKKQALALKAADYGTQGEPCPACRRKPINPELVARAMRQTSDVIDAIVRLSQFVQGAPDSRPDHGAGSVLAELTDAQLDQVQAWVSANRAGQRR